MCRFDSRIVQMDDGFTDLFLEKCRRDPECTARISTTAFQMVEISLYAYTCLVVQILYRKNHISFLIICTLIKATDNKYTFTNTSCRKCKQHYPVVSWIHPRYYVYQQGYGINSNGSYYVAIFEPYLLVRKQSRPFLPI